MKILFYEIGYDNSNILGSGTDYVVEYTTKYEHEAFYYFSQPGMTFLRRTIRDGRHLRHEFYNRYSGLWF